MKKFLSYIGILILGVVLLLYTLDFIYTSVYKNSVPRNKVSYILNQKNEKIDYIFLGSSRVDNFIDSEIITKITGKKALNLGVQGAKFDDYYLMLQLLQKQNIHSEIIFVQVDYVFNLKGTSNILKGELMPFIDDPVISKYIKKRDDNFWELRNIPFYRYMVYDYKLGFREFFSSLIQKRPRVDLENGYNAKYGTLENLKASLPDHISDRNAVLNKMRKLARKQDIKLVFFTSPFCENTSNLSYMDKLGEKFDDYTNYAELFKEKDHYFYNCSHVNDKGARAFSKRMAEDIVKNIKVKLMHIAFLTTEYPHEKTGRYGGIGTSIKNAAEALVALGVQVSVFVMSQQLDLVMVENGVKLHLIKQRKYKFLSWFFYKKYIQNYINKEVKKQQINVIEAPDWSGISAFIKFACPLVIRFHGSDAYFCELESRKQKPKNFWLEKTALRGADHLVSVSRFTAERTRSLFNLKKEIKIIPNGVNTEYFTPKPELEEENTLFYFGSLIRKKGVLDLAEIFNKIVEKQPQTQLFFAGTDVTDLKTGKSTQVLIQEILSPQAKQNTHFLGKIDYSAIKNELQKATVVALPSHAEALPMTWLEAMAMGKALVTSDIGWAREVMLNGETGFCVHPKDHEVYTDKILELLNDKELRQKVGKATRTRIIQQFSNEVVAQKNLKFYKNCCRS